MFIGFERLIDAKSDHDAHRTVIKNLILMISDSYFKLEKRMSMLTSGRLSHRIARYLLEHSSRAGGDIFAVPHSRESQARFLGCERSALSRELSRMKRDGIIDYKRDRFAILDRNRLERE